MHQAISAHQWQRSSSERLCIYMGTTLKFITAYHPKSDGENRESTGTTPDFKLQRTPFEIVCGRSPPTLTHFNRRDTLEDAVALDLIARDGALHQLK
ncbi:hypothetical protein L195_g011798 [Trifolium pratense]|uniref:Uncharacterized protein n=1 Tax=Trifolium pratense TaxID=57577 RepID=A0A2K3PIL1_TRIPR|nr:hypothetical protein L195_g011798 [Trifolium pratense]